jgi:hypothetical protein
MFSFFSKKVENRTIVIVVVGLLLVGLACGYAYYRWRIRRRN